MDNSIITGVLVDGVGLPVVLGDLVVDHGDDVGPDGGLVHGGEGDHAAGSLILLGVDGDHGAGGGKSLKKKRKTILKEILLKKKIIIKIIMIVDFINHQGSTGA